MAEIKCIFDDLPPLGDAVAFQRWQNKWPLKNKISIADNVGIRIVDDPFTKERWLEAACFRSSEKQWSRATRKNP